MLTPEEHQRLLRYNVLLSRSSDEPLHAQLTRSLRNLVLRHFSKGEQFYTEEELAEKLHLSVGTVRRSLNRLVEEGLLDRRRGQGSFVCQTEQDRRKGRRFVAFVNTFDSFYDNMLLREFSYLCLKRSHTLEVVNPGQDERASRVLDFATVGHGRTGFIFVSLEPDFVHDLGQLLRSRQLPSVNMDTWLPGYPGNQVGIDNRHGIELGLDHLYNLGHRRIALLLSEWTGHENIRERIQAFQQGVAARGIEGIMIEASPLPHFEDLNAELRLPTQVRYDYLIDAQVAQRVLDSGASAVFCVSDIGACFLMKRLNMACKHIPEEISVIGFNDEGTGKMVYPELTTIAQPFADMAKTALNMLESPDDSMRHVRIAPNLVIRKSTGPHRGAP
ncbi:MAG TPA: GntR family transcriptional regulator [Candidatus Hydrogenedentes bacterium]|nr:GntR family transcriptional regulator [Candidatus Hydrogenedentota bacterium]